MSHDPSTPKEPAPSASGTPAGEITISVFGRTDVGLIREHNEDNFLVANIDADFRTHDMEAPNVFTLGNKGAVFLVCDGMGGAAAGEVASLMAVDSISSSMASNTPSTRDEFARGLRRAVEDANDKIYAQSRDNQSERGMGTTCTVAALMDGTLVVGQIGDSRCYVVRKGRLAQVTKDQSLAWQLIEAGAMTPEEAKQFEHANIILQALGVQERVDVVLSQVPLRRGDVVLISSDGLHGPVGDDEIIDILRAEPDIKRAADMLIARALEHEGPDNVTVVLIKAEGDGLPEPTEADLVEFVPYDPGRVPGERPEPTEKATQEVTVPREFISMTNDAGLKTLQDIPVPGRGNNKSGKDSDGRSVMVFALLVLIAALVAGLSLHFDRTRALEEEQNLVLPAATTPTPAAPQTP
ncbi:MAG: PP2C family serine/threonine-protein phosphatase [Deltaproteobacteria bacterium]|nr:PP2C family serine/threonine-protein phosphatase [Deltaproteobacteria bacterium]